MLTILRYALARICFALVAAIYVAGYFAVSEIRTTPVGDIRVFNSEIIYDVYTPLHAIDERVTGRPMGFSE